MSVIDLFPEFVVLWQLLAESYYNLGDETRADKALTQHGMIKSFNHTLSDAEHYFKEDDFQSCDQICRKLLVLVPNEPRVLMLMAKISQQFGHTDITVDIISQCLKIRPGDFKITLVYINYLLENKQAIKALEYCEILLAKYPHNLEVMPLKAAAEIRLGLYKAALSTYTKILPLHPQKGLSLLRYGNILKTVGETAEAIKTFHQAIQYDNSLGEAYWSLANLKIYHFSDIEILAMEQHLKSTTLTKQSRAFFHFSLGNAYDHKQNYAKSFMHYKQGNDLCHKPLHKNSNEQVEKLKTFFSIDYFKTQKKEGVQSEDPIFIVGLPRSGSTLVEQILSSHSQVDGTMELTEIVSIVRELNSPSRQGKAGYPESLTQLSSTQLEQIGQRYLKYVEPMRQGGRFFIDKLPNNFHHIGLIKTIFPKAKIIDVRRNAMASGWSIYTQFFAEGNSFSYSFEDIANNYINLMDHWHNVLPGQILTLSYEQLINDFDNTLDQIVEYCGLAMEDNCKKFFENKRAVATPSSEQVRQPIYQDALEHWKNYVNFLQPLSQKVG